MIRPLDRFDGALALAIFLVSAGIGSAYTSIPAVARAATLYPDTVGPAVLWACGRGFTGTSGLEAQDPLAAAALDRFLERDIDRFDCGVLPATVSAGPLSPFQLQSRYLLVALGVIWRAGDPSWRGLVPLYGLLFAVTSVCAFALMRAAMNRTIAVLATLALVSSPIQLASLPHLRDYSKAPFFLFMLAALAHVAIGRLTRRATIGWCALVGAVIGIGAGFRFDVNQYALFFAGAVMIFLPGSLRLEWRTRAAGAAVCLAAFAVVASPILLAPRGSSNAWHVVLLGFADRHDEALGVQPAAYRLGSLYDDSLVSNTVNAYGGRLYGTTGVIALASRDYIELSGEYYRALARAFPADVVVRAWAAVARVLWKPFTPAALGPPPGVSAHALVTLYRGRHGLLWLSGRAMPWLPVATVVLLARWQPRLAWLIATCVIGFAGVSSLQFQPRHIFHLEVMTVWLFGFAANAIVAAAIARREHVDWRHGWGRAAAFATAVGAFAIVPVAGLRAYQQPRAEALLARYVAEATTVIPVVRESHRDGSAWFPIVGVTGGQRVMIPSQLIVAEFGRQGCAVETAHATIRYAPAQGIDFSRSADVPIPVHDGDASRLLFPVVGPPADSREPQFQIAGLELPAAEAGCLRQMRSLADPRRFAILLDATLPPLWRQQPLYQRLQASEFLRPGVEELR